MSTQYLTGDAIFNAIDRERQELSRQQRQDTLTHVCELMRARGVGEHAIQSALHGFHAFLQPRHIRHPRNSQYPNYMCNPRNIRHHRNHQPPTRPLIVIIVRAGRLRGWAGTFTVALGHPRRALMIFADQMQQCALPVL